MFVSMDFIFNHAPCEPIQWNDPIQTACNCHRMHPRNILPIIQFSLVSHHEQRNCRTATHPRRQRHSLGRSPESMRSSGGMLHDCSGQCSLDGSRYSMIATYFELYLFWFLISFDLISFCSTLGVFVDSIASAVARVLAAGWICCRYRPTCRSFASSTTFLELTRREANCLPKILRSVLPSVLFPRWAHFRFNI
jgi:hypothetical protein